MSVNYIDKSTGDLIRVAGQGKAEYGASTVRKGRVSTPAISAGGGQTVQVTFAEPMPDNDYEIEYSSNNNPWGGLIFIDEGTKTKNGFNYYIKAPNDESLSAGYLSYTAFKLYTDTEYNSLLDLPDRVETLETLASDVIPSEASVNNKLATRNEIYILSNQYNGATYTTVNALLEKVAADILAKGGYGGAVGSVWLGKSYFSGTYGTDGRTGGNARLHFENAQGGYTECVFSFTSSGLGTVQWFNDVTTSSVTSGSTAPITSGGVYSALNNKTSVTATSANNIYLGNYTIYYYSQTKRMLFNQCAFVYTQGSTMPAGKTLCTITIPDGITIPEKGIIIPAMLSVAATSEKLPSAVILNTDGTIVTTNSETNYNYVNIYGANVFFE